MPKSTNEKYKKLTLPIDYCFEDLDRDLIQLDEILKTSNVKVSDRFHLIKPIASKIPRNTRLLDKYGQTVRFYWLSRIAMAMLFLLTMAILFRHREPLYWHVSAAGRIIMIKMLPYFDWRYLKNEICLIPKLSDRTKPSLFHPEFFDCDLCESLRDFDYFTVHTNEAVLPEFIQKFIEVDKPLIVAGGIDHWIKESPEEFIDQIMEKEEFANSIPCNLCTNIHNSRRGDVDLITLFQKKDFFDSFFIHFQNCDIDAMRVFRNFTYRPNVLPEELSPVTYNWLLWNKNYNSMKYKKIYLVEKHTVIGQIFGSTRLKLIPRKNCQDMCPVLEGVLPAGYLLILTSLWDVEYLPEGEGDNIAAVLEIKG